MTVRWATIMFGYSIGVRSSVSKDRTGFGFVESQVLRSLSRMAHLVWRSGIMASRLGAGAIRMSSRVSRISGRAAKMSKRVSLGDLGWFFQGMVFHSGRLRKVALRMVAAEMSCDMVRAGCTGE